MADPENQTLRILRDIRTAMNAMDSRIEAARRQSRRISEARLDNIRQAINGESVLGRYAAAEVEERLDLLEKRVTALERRAR